MVSLPLAYAIVRLRGLYNTLFGLIPAQVAFGIPITVPLALQSFEGQFGIDIPGLMAAVVLSALPIILLYVFAQRQLVGGLTAGSGK